MGLWNNLKANTGAGFDDNINKYGNQLDKTNQTVNNQSNLNNQYTGNTGYNNALQQGMQGAAVTAGQAGANAARAARNSGMAGSRAALLGAQQAADAYGGNVALQQSMANQAGMNAISANQGLANTQMNLGSQYGNVAGMNAQEKQNVYNRARGNTEMLGNIIGNVGKGLIGLSDERMKDLQDRTDGLSKLVENIDTYLYKYTDEAQKEYPEETDDKEKVGVMAQELEENPVTASSVVEDEKGIKHVNTGQLALQAIGLISDLSKRISELEGDKE